MKINPLFHQQLIDQYKASRVPLKPGKPSVAANDQVSFSDEALSFSATLSKLREKVEVRSPEEQTRIDSLVQQIRTGTYQVDSERIVDKMLPDLMSED